MPEYGRRRVHHVQAPPVGLCSVRERSGDEPGVNTQATAEVRSRAPDPRNPWSQRRGSGIALAQKLWRSQDPRISGDSRICGDQQISATLEASSGGQAERAEPYGDPATQVGFGFEQTRPR